MGKTVLLVDDEQVFLEALGDALEYEGYRVLKADTAEGAVAILKREKIDCATVDIMLSPGSSLEDRTSSHEAGIMLCEAITTQYPQVDVFCLSVVNDRATISKIQSMGVKFLRKGETPLKTVLAMIRTRLTGIAYSTEPGITHSTKKASISEIEELLHLPRRLRRLQ